MGKKITILFLFVWLSSVLYAKQIDVNQAQNVALRFLKGDTQLRSSSSSSLLKLVHTAKDESSQLKRTNPTSYYYVFNIGDNDGFVIVSADDINVPIIGYSTKGKYDPNNLPDNFKGWMQTVEKGMSEAIAKGTASDPSLQSQWNSVSTRAAGGTTPPTEGGGNPVESTGDYLVKTQWNQIYPYNAHIPELISGQGYPYTGCVPTAFAQIMKYHNYPTRGTGTVGGYRVSYNVLMPSIDLSKYTYNWAKMLPSYGYNVTYTEEEKNAVALLMFHFGLASKTNFGYTGSSAYDSDGAKVLLNNFGYDNDMYTAGRIHYSDEEWFSFIKTEINNRRPLIYAANIDIYTPGHVFICDGYDKNGYFHLNWGWGGDSDGFFNLDAPLNYSVGQGIIGNIKPENHVFEEIEMEPILFQISVNKDTYMRNEMVHLNYEIYEIFVSDSRKADCYGALYTLDDKFVSFLTHLEGSAKYNQIPDTLAKGVYKIKIVEKTLSGKYIPLRKKKGLEDPRITVTEEVKSHSISFSTPINSSSIDPFVGGTVAVSSTLQSPISRKVDIDGVLVDENNKRIQLNSCLKDHNPYGDFSYSFKIADTIPVGRYKLFFVAREKNKKWAEILSTYGGNINYLQFDVFRNKSDYRVNNIMLVDAIENKGCVRKNEGFQVVAYFTSNINDLTRIKKLKIALCDSNDNTLSILYSDFDPDVEAPVSNYIIYAKSDMDIPAGNYKIKLVEETTSGIYCLPLVTENYQSLPLTILDEEIEHQLYLTDDLETEKTVVSIGDPFPVKVAFKNNSPSYFKGSIGLTIVDNTGNIQTPFSTPYLGGINMPPYSSYSKKYEFFYGQK